MRCLLLLALVACSSKPAPIAKPELPTGGSAEAKPEAPASPITKEKLAADTPRTSVAGNTFIAPSGWTIWVQGPATVLETPEGGSKVAIVDVKAKSPDQARDLAWAAFEPSAPKRKILQTASSPDKDGWSGATQYAYETAKNEQRNVAAVAMFANDTWTVIVVDVDDAVGEKRGAQFGMIFGQLLPKGGERESFAGKKANPLDAARIATLTKFVEDSAKTLDVPGVSLGIVENGKTVFLGGFGVREVGKPAKPDGDTKYIIASNTKALTTLMLAKLVDEKKLTWDTPATTLYPEFKLGDAETTKQVLVRHLICACTGMPRQDLELIVGYKNQTAVEVMKMLGTMQPTSKFGELFQYSNIMAAAAGYIGGHVAFPKLELGAAYDQAMAKYVFEPLGMKSTTFDYKKAQTGNYALPYDLDLEGKVRPSIAALNNTVIPFRPAGAAWSSTRDVLEYVKMELAEGKLGNGKQYISKEALFARREKSVAMGKDAIYGMGLMVGRRYGTPIVHHGGDVFGYHSDMVWLPEHGVGMVILTNGTTGSSLRGMVTRRLLEILFDGKPEAAAEVASARKNLDESLVVARAQLVIPADPAEAGKLAKRYANGKLGEIAVTVSGGKTTFDFGNFKSEMATHKNADGTIGFVTIAPSLTGLEMIVGTGDKKTLTLRDAQHEYVFTEK